MATPNPFRIAGELLPEEMIDRDVEAARLRTLAEGGHASRLVAPRRYGKTSLLRRVLVEASGSGWATALVDLEGVLSLSSMVVRIERAYDRSLKGPVRRTVDALFRSWKVGLSLGAGGFTASIQSNPRIDVESVFLRLLDLPAKVHERTGARSLVAFDEFQDLLRVDGADGMLRSVIQHQTGVASYAFAGSAPTLMERLFEDPSRPLLEHAVPVELGALPDDVSGECARGAIPRGRVGTSGTRSTRSSRSPAGIRSGSCSSRTTCGSSSRRDRSPTRRRSSTLASVRSRSPSPHCGRAGSRSR